MAAQTSLKRAINPICKAYIYGSGVQVRWRQQEQACAVESCSLWAYKPRIKPKCAYSETVGSTDDDDK